MDACAYGELPLSHLLHLVPLVFAPAPHPHWEETICHPVVRDNTLGLVPVTLRSPATPSPTVCPSLQDQSRECTRARKERTTIKGILKM